MRPFAFTLALAVVSTASTAQPDRHYLVAVAVEELGRMYLECDRHAGMMLLGATEAAHCSMVSEELMQRGFGGDFRRLLAWWQSQRRDEVKPSTKRAPSTEGLQR